MDPVVSEATGLLEAIKCTFKLQALPAISRAVDSFE